MDRDRAWEVVQLELASNSSSLIAKLKPAISIRMRMAATELSVCVLKHAYAYALYEDCSMMVSEHKVDRLRDERLNRRYSNGSAPGR